MLRLVLQTIDPILYSSLVAECSEGFYCTGGSVTDQPYSNSTGGGDICPLYHFCAQGKDLQLFHKCSV